MNSKQDSLIKLANKCVYYGKYEYARLVIAKLLEFSGEEPEIYNAICELYLKMDSYDLAFGYVSKSFEKEKSIETLKLLAKTNYTRKNYEDSAIQYEELTKYEDNEATYNYCIQSYEQINLEEEAIRIAQQYVEKHKTANAYAKLGFLYIEVGMEKEAIEICNTMEKEFSNSPITYNTFGFLYESIYNDYEKAKKYFHKAAKLGFIDAYYNLGVCCKQSEDFVNAEKYLKRLISLNANPSMDYNYTLGSVYMAQRKLALGYKYYKNRKSAKEINYKNQKNLWDGKDYPDKILYVQHEQGYGDNLQFCRYIPLVAKKFKKVIYATTPNLVELFKRSFSQEKYPNIEIVPVGEVFRYHKFALIMDLPYLLHMNYYNIPFSKGYLCADERKVKIAKQNYFNTDKIKIGLNWRAKGMGLRDAVYRTIDAPYYFKNLFDIEDVEFYSFQMGDIFKMCEKYPQIKDLSQEFTTFDETAAYLKNLDVLITVDTALAHLAGGLGIKTFLLLCHAPDWRWFDNTEKTEWYDSITIIKQNDRRTWDDVALKLEDSLKKYISRIS